MKQMHLRSLKMRATPLLLSLSIGLAASACSSKEAETESPVPEADAVADVTSSPDTVEPDTIEPDTRAIEDTGLDVEPTGTKALVNPNGAALYDSPWPTDLRRRADGTIDMSGFPNPKNINLVNTYLAAAERLDGYGLTPSIVIRFDAEVDPKSLTDQLQSGEPGSNIILVDVDKESFNFGRRYPVRAEWSGPNATATHIEPNTMIIQPLFGTPLSESTTYAAILTRGVLDAAGEPIATPNIIRDGMAGTGVFGELFVSINFWMTHGGDIQPSDVAVATVFTTGSPTRELREIAAWIRDDLEITESTDFVLAGEEWQKPAYSMYEGRYVTPNLQFGEKPYSTEGGDIRFEDGKPVVQLQEELRFAVTIPTGEMPKEGWPLVLYGHGTGGDWKSFASGARPVSVELAESGFAVMGIDQPLHGERATGPNSDPELNSFNFFNPSAARSNFRQSAIDVLAQARFVKAMQFTDADDNPITFDPSNLYFFGHSHGALAGGLLAPFSQDFKAIILSAAGGGISNTVMLRKDPIDFEALLKAALVVDDPNELSIAHPVISLVQMLVDITDPLAYAPHYQNPGVGLAPINILMTEGPEDTATPGSTTDNLASAARIPIINPQDHSSVSHGIIGLLNVDPPVEENYKSIEGLKATSVLAHFEGHGHFAVFQSAKAIKMYRRFLTTARDNGVPTVDFK